MAIEREADRSILSLVRGLLDDVRDLFREEVALARAEVRQEVSRARTAGILLGVSVVSLAIGGLFILTALARGIALAFGWPIWTGFALVGFLLAVVGGITLAAGIGRLKRVHAIPPQTAESVKENVEWIRTRTRSDVR